jgi:hypothetical protein
MTFRKSQILYFARILFFLITVASLLAFVFYEFNVLTTPLDKPIDKKVRESHKNTLIVALTFSILSGLLFFINKSQSKSALDNILYNDFDSYVDVSV